MCYSRYAETRAGIDDGLYRIGAGTVAEKARLSALSGPAAIPVHYHGDVVRQAFRINAAQKSSFGRTGLNNFREMRERIEQTLHTVRSSTPTIAVRLIGP
jgi:hypothetical protein